jgi:hypothetical protein
VLADPEPEVADRARAVLALVRCCRRRAPVLVGHSIFFRALCARLLAAAGEGGGGVAAMERNRPALTEQLRRRRKLGNAAVLAVTVYFGPGGAEPVMEDADLIFGSFADE